MIRKVVLGTIILSGILIGLVILTLALWLGSKPSVEKAWVPEILQDGNIAPLSQGGTYYEDKGPRDGEVVLMMHGSIVPNVVFDNNFNELSNEFRVIRFDFYGRGLSARPTRDFSIDLYMQQINELLAHLEVDQPVHVVGLSMGGAIGTIYCEKYPQSVRSITLLDPVTPSSFENDTTSFATRIRKRVKKIQKRLNEDEETAVKDLMDKASTQFLYRGVGRSIFSAVKYLKESDLVTPYLSLVETHKPVLLIWGEKDDVIPVKEAQVVQALVPHTEFYLIEDAGHVPHYEYPEVVNPILRQFFQRY